MKKVLLIILTLFLGVGVAIINSPKTQAYENNSYLIIITNTPATTSLFVFDVAEDAFNTYDYGDIDINDIVDYTILRRGDVLQYDIVFNSFDYWAYEITTSGYEGYDKLPDGFLETYLGAIYYFANNNGLTTGHATGYAEGYTVGVNEVEADAYNHGVDDGFLLGLNYKANEFYNNIGTWLVPAIIVVLFLGGFIAFARKKRDGVE